ncbi:hypothetical protein STAFG_1332 [Streptomyces afghaniensis 772]|uniref:Uncharacterized protein n=1 Tax=Streptomyces afghaniensis 772 TaxID=1283301 RepID=S4MX69_9ACTN|nr:MULTISPECIES: hypothetical protein [Streptomyces]EPJ41601.1 hypothetical protein STAFG_1332 [Streptomyces afghaniensis 772]UOB13235.1 hypothetical protein MQE23_31155 [Streptomyces sp. HP-A2021]
MSDMTRPPGDDTRDAQVTSDTRVTPVTSHTPGTRGSSADPDARGETALGTGHGTGLAGAKEREGTSQGSHGTPAHLLPHDESDKLTSQLHHAVAEFVDAPRAAVEEADHVLEEIAARFTEAVTQRRRTLRHSWQAVEGGEGKPVSSGDTEQLRLALKDYRELAERLLHV